MLKITKTGFYENPHFTGIVIYDECIIYCRNGLYHRVDGPAVIYWDNSKYYYYNDWYHRLGGPAEFYFNKNNNLVENYWIYGKLITKEQHDFYYQVYLESKEDLEDLLKFEGIYEKDYSEDFNK